MNHRLLSISKLLSTLFVVLLLAACLPAFDQGVDGPPAGPHGSREPVVFVHGGTIDDYVSYLLLTTMDNIDLRGVVLTNTDTLADQAMQIQWKIMGLIQNTDLPIGLSGARGWNPFPWLYRSDAVRQYNIKALSGVEDNQDWPPYPSGDTLLHEILSEAVDKDSPITLLITCPLTPLSDLLERHPELKDGIGRLIWMGGAIYADGNLDPNTIPAEVANPKAEWNAFWDPPSVDWVFRNTSFPIVLFPLDVTDQAPITEEFKDTLEDQAPRYLFSDIVSQSYALVGDEPFFEMWNSLTTAYVAHPEFFEAPKTMNLSIVTEGYDQGAIQPAPDGRQVEVVLNIAHSDAFYGYVLEQLKRDSAPR